MDEYFMTWQFFLIFSSSTSFDTESIKFMIAFNGFATRGYIDKK
jgi:hypothetical protein